MCSFTFSSCPQNSNSPLQLAWLISLISLYHTVSPVWNQFDQFVKQWEIYRNLNPAMVMAWSWRGHGVMAWPWRKARVDLGRVHTKGFTCTTSVSCWAKPLKQTIQCLDRGFHGGHWQNEGYDSILFNPGDGGHQAAPRLSISSMLIIFILRVVQIWLDLSSISNISNM